MLKNAKCTQAYLPSVVPGSHSCTIDSRRSLNLCNGKARQHFLATVHCSVTVVADLTWLSSRLHCLQSCSEVPRVDSRAGPEAPNKPHSSSSSVENCGVDLGILERFLT